MKKKTITFLKSGLFSNGNFNVVFLKSFKKVDLIFFRFTFTAQFKPIVFKNINFKEKIDLLKIYLNNFFLDIIPRLNSIKFLSFALITFNKADQNVAIDYSIQILIGLKRGFTASSLVDFFNELPFNSNFCLYPVACLELKTEQALLDFLILMEKNDESAQENIIFIFKQSDNPETQLLFTKVVVWLKRLSLYFRINNDYEISHNFPFKKN